MKKYFAIYILLLFTVSSNAQENIYPAKAQSKKIIITGGTVHVGNGSVLENNGAIVIENGKITAIGNNAATDNNATVINAAGKHIYPGLILASSNLGLQEITGSVRGTNDVFEIGELNPNVRSIVAYNTDSRITNTLRSNGILLANVIPKGSVIGGSSSTVQLDAWTWEDAAYNTDYGMHFYMPSLFNRPNRFAAQAQGPQIDPVKRGLEQIEGVKQFFRDAKAWLQQPTKTTTNLKFEAVKGLFNKKQRLFIHCRVVKEMLAAIDFVKEFGFDVTLVGAEECWMIPDLLKQNNISVILLQTHNLPTLDDDDVDLPFKIPAILQKAGVLFALSDEDGQTRGRNLPFNAGTAVTYGLSKEEALSSITLNAATILGIANRTGTIETGKDANLVISEGDILDMRTSIITQAFIQGRSIDLNDKHKQLNERYLLKYGLK